MDYKPYIDILSALLTPIIAIITTYIAIQQYRTNKLKFRHELYDKRLAIFNSTMQFIGHILKKADVSLDELYKFNAGTNESYFLFGKDVHEHLWEMYMQGVDLYQVNEEMQGAEEGQRHELAQRKRELIKNFRNQVEVSRERFAKYMSIKSLK